MDESPYIDARFEFQAPKYVDFLNPTPGIDAEKWFDMHQETVRPNKKRKVDETPSFTPFSSIKKFEFQNVSPNTYSSNVVKTLFQDEEKEQSQTKKPQKMKLTVPKLYTSLRKSQQTSASIKKKRRSSLLKKYQEACRHGNTNISKIHYKVSISKSKVGRTSLQKNKLSSYKSIHSPFEKSLIQKFNEFSEHVPSRFKSKPDEKPVHKPLKLTVPKEFSLATSQRSHQRQQMSQNKSSTFKARPLNKKIFETGGTLGVPKVKSKEVTVPQEFNLRTNTRKRKVEQIYTRQVSFSSTQKAPFKVVPRKQKKKTNIRKCLTVPQSPKLQTKLRARTNNEETKVEEKNFVFKAKPMPKFKPYKTKKSNTKLVEPEPFNLATEIRGKEHERELQEKLKKEAEELKKKREFKAKPILTVEHSTVGHVEKPPLTIPEPFELASEKLHKRSLRELEEKMRRLEEEIKNRAIFKANPMPYLDRPTFVPQRSNAPLTEVSEFNLNTSRRVEERKHFEDELKQKMMMKEEQQKKEEMRKKRQELLEIRRLRKKMEFKARPVPIFKTPKIKPSDKPLTSPHSPLLGKKSMRLSNVR